MSELDKEKIISFLKNLRLLRATSFLVMYFFGWFFGWYFSVYDLNYLTLGLGLIAIFFVWQFCVSLNDIFDIEIDRISNPDRPYTKGYIDKKKYIIISIILGGVSIFIGIFISLLSMIFIILFIILGYIYSAPPTRLRKYIFGTIFIGSGSALSYFAGIFSIVPILTMQQLMIGILIFIALSMGTVVKDYKDYEGDKKAGVSTIFTKYGLEKGTKIASVLLFITFMIPLLLINHIIDIIIIVTMAILVVLLFNLKKIKRKTQITMLLFFIDILYIFLRLINVIMF